MNSDQLEGKWKQAKGTVKERWGKLTDDDVDVINGRTDQLVGKIQEQYGIARLALKLGLMLTEPKVRAEIGERLKDQVGSVTDTLADKYEDAVERLEAAQSALRGVSNWTPGITGFLLGAGIGVGLGILFAPSASDAAGKIREAVTMPFTGTEG